MTEERVTDDKGRVLQKVNSAVSNKAKNYKTAIVGVPTFGYVSVNWHLNMLGLATPMMFTVQWIHPVGKPVDEARNMVVDQAIKNEADYVFFVDDDVLVPRDAILRLFNHDVPIVSGVYYSKIQPPKPLVFRFGTLSGIEDWNPGDLLKVDACGMGCTLIRTDVFKKMAPPWFRTIRDFNGDQPAIYTEDIYFCERVRHELGLDVIVDTGVQCVHEDFEAGLHYYFEPKIGHGAWRDFRTGEVMYLPKAGRNPKLLKDKTTDKGKTA